jgi:NAD(P)H-dependent FMN reductase
MNIEIISSSPRSNSITHRVAVYLKNYLQENTEHNVGIIDVREWNLGLLENVFNSIDNTPEKYQPLAKKIFASDAFIVVTPEYNGTYTPALNNLFDHFPKQSKKAFGLVTASTGAMGGMRASQQLLLLVPALFGFASPQMLVIPSVDKKFNENGELTDELFLKSVHSFFSEFLWLANQLSK